MPETALTQPFKCVQARLASGRCFVDPLLALPHLHRPQRPPRHRLWMARPPTQHVSPCFTLIDLEFRLRFQ